VSSWTVDGIQLQAEQYVEVSDDVPASAFPPTLVQVKSPDQARRTLTLQGAPPNLANATAPHIRHVVTYRTQPDYPVPADAPLGSATGTYQVYVDVWGRPITACQTTRTSIERAGHGFGDGQASWTASDLDERDAPFSQPSHDLRPPLRIVGRPVCDRRAGDDDPWEPFLGHTLHQPGDIRGRSEVAQKVCGCHVRHRPVASTIASDSHVRITWR
jgi:hypothetical protein